MSLDFMAGWVMGVATLPLLGLCNRLLRLAQGDYLPVHKERREMWVRDGKL